MTFRYIFLFSLVILTSSFHASVHKTCSVHNNEFFVHPFTKVFKLKRTHFNSYAKYQTGNYVVYVDKKEITAALRPHIADSAYVQMVNPDNDTLDLNKIVRQYNRDLVEAIIKQLEKEEAIIINTESGQPVNKIIRRKYNRKTVRTKRKAGIEYIDPKTQSILFDLLLWIS